MFILVAEQGGVAMSGISSLLNTAKGALIVQQKAMTVTGHNIANVNTPGYTRQKTILESNAPFSTTQMKIGMGVRIDSVVQSVDPFINGTIQRGTSTLQEYEAKAYVLSQVETVFNETTDQGLAAVMNEFWNAWQDLANNPGGIPERTALLGKGEILARRFNSMREDLSQISGTMNENIGKSLEEINRLTREIADLNEKIVSAESFNTPANDLRDQRTNLVAQVSELVGNVSLEDKNGSLTVLTSSGILLVDRDQSWELTQDGNEIHWNHIATDISGRLQGGKVGAWLDIRDEVIPQSIANLDELAGTFIREVNQLHRAGYALSGATGLDFFEDFQTPPSVPNSGDYTNAAGFIRLSTDVAGAPAQIAAGGLSGDPGDNENALRILALQTDGTLSIRKWTYGDRGETVTSSLETETMEDYYRALTGEIGIVTEEMNQNQQFQQAIMDQLAEMRDSVSGVNLDEEMTDLMKLQQAYEAAAKLVTIADEMLQSLLQMR
jgi:flagellar hook-associated protein 1 FlgK